MMRLLRRRVDGRLLVSCAHGGTQSFYAAPRAVLEPGQPVPGSGNREAFLIGLVAPLCVAPLLWLASWGRKLAGVGSGPELDLLVGQIVMLVFYQVLLGAGVYRGLSNLMGASPPAFVIAGAVPLAALAGLIGGLVWAMSMFLTGAAMGGVTWALLRKYASRPSR
jgi:hypothetical protein